MRLSTKSADILNRGVVTVVMYCGVCGCASVGESVQVDLQLQGTRYALCVMRVFECVYAVGRVYVCMYVCNSVFKSVVAYRIAWACRTRMSGDRIGSSACMHTWHGNILGNA